MTRSDDSFVPLAERVRIARQRQAQLFISIHCDALARGDGEPRRNDLYAVGQRFRRRGGPARRRGKPRRRDLGRRLSVEPDDIADILIDLAQRETKTFSMQFAQHVVKSLKGAARLHKHPLKGAGFKVLKAPTCPQC